MKKFILSIGITLLELVAFGQNLHYYNPTPTVSEAKKGSTTINLGYNRQRLVGEVSVNVLPNLILTGAYSGLNKSMQSFFSPNVNVIHEDLLIGSLSASYIYKLSNEKLAIEGQVSGSNTRYNYADLPVIEPNAQNVYREKVSFDENALHTAVLLHIYKKKSDIYFGFKHVESLYGKLLISNSMFDEKVERTKSRSTGDGLVLGYVYRHKKISIHTQLGVLSAASVKLEQEETIHNWWFGVADRTYTNSTMYSGTDLTSMIKIGYTLN